MRTSDPSRTPVLRPTLPALLLAAWLGGCTLPPVMAYPSDAGVQGDGGADVPGLSTSRCRTSADCAAGESCLAALGPDGGYDGRQCFAGACDLVAQNCGAGERCTYVRSDAGVAARACVADGTQEAGAECVATPPRDNCRAGTLCLGQPGPDGGLRAACTRVCDVDAQCGAPDECRGLAPVKGSAERPLVCAPPAARCDPLAPACAGPTEGCYPDPVRGASLCAPAGAVAEGQACAFSNDCAPGHTCAAGVCRPVCDPRRADTCAGGTCQPLEGFANVGACAR